MHDSEAAARAMAQLMARTDGPSWLYDEWSSGRIADDDLPSLIHRAWTRHDWPESAIGAPAWVRIFRAAGYVAVPNYLRQPVDPLIAYRGATDRRKRGMAWSTSSERAGQFRDGRVKRGKEAFVYVTTIPPIAVLAQLGDRAEYEVVVDPMHLGDIERFD